MVSGGQRVLLLRQLEGRVGKWGCYLLYNLAVVVAVYLPECIAAMSDGGGCRPNIFLCVCVSVYVMTPLWSPRGKPMS